MNFKVAGRRKNQRGAVLILVAAALPVLLAFVGLTIEWGRSLVVRNELQNAADSGALAAVQGIVSTTRTNAGTLDWTLGKSSAVLAVGLNSADAASRDLVPREPEFGWWNPVTEQGVFSTITPPTRPLTPAGGTAHMPAVKVTVGLSAQENEGPMEFIFAPIMRLLRPDFSSGRDISAEAIAIVANAGSAGTGALFPIMLNQCLWSSLWNNGSPTVSEIAILGGTATGCSGVTGDWTTLGASGSSSADTINKLINDYGSTASGITASAATAVGSVISINSGVVVGPTFDAIQSRINNQGPIRAVMPVVNTISGSSATIVGFGAIEITRVFVSGNTRIIYGKFMAGYPGAGLSVGNGSGGDFGAVAMDPILVF
jgi:hypothetical protein